MINENNIKNIVETNSIHHAAQPDQVISGHHAGQPAVDEAVIHHGNQSVIDESQIHHGSIEEQVTGSEIIVDEYENEKDNGVHHGQVHHQPGHHAADTTINNKRSENTMKNNLNTTLAGIAVLFAIILGINLSVDAKSIDIDRIGSDVRDLNIRVISGSRIDEIAAININGALLINDDITGRISNNIEINRIDSVISSIDTIDNVISENVISGRILKINDRIDKTNLTGTKVVLTDKIDLIDKVDLTGKLDLSDRISRIDGRDPINRTNLINEINRIDLIDLKNRIDLIN